MKLEPAAIRIAMTVLLGAGFVGPVPADPGKDESGHGHKGTREVKQEFWDGNCKVERKWEKNGSYKEERKCDAPARQRTGVAPPPPVVIYPPWVVVDRGGPGYRRGQEPEPAQGPVWHCNSSALGQILGGAAGAVVGSRVGQGGGRVAATVGGAVIGMLIGGEIGRQIDRDNQACIAQALEFAPSGRRIAWPGGAGSGYAVVPGQVVRRDGRHCRRYEAEVQTPDGWRRTTGLACRRADGAWIAAG